MINIKKILPFVICIILFGVLGVYIFNIDNNEISIDSHSDVMFDSKKEEVLVNEKLIIDLREQYNNDDVVGVIKIGNNEEEVVLVQGEDNSYYLNHDYHKNYYIGGSVFVDSRIDINDSKKILIFGHNAPKKDRALSVLENYYDKEYYNNNKYIKLSTTVGDKLFEIFSVYVEVSDWSYMRINFKNNVEFKNHINTLRNRSLYDTGVSVGEEDNVIILQTCSYHKDYKKYNKKYLLVMAKEVKSSD